MAVIKSAIQGFFWIAVTSPALPTSVRSKSTLSPTATASVIVGAALHAIVIAGHLASGIGPWSSVTVPAVLSMAVTVPWPLAMIGAVAAGPIACVEHEVRSATKADGTKYKSCPLQEV